MRTAVICLVAYFAAAASAVVPVHGQTPETGAVSGRVLDGAAPVGGVVVELRSRALPGLRTAVTRDDGSFRFTLLPPGDYTISIPRTGLIKLVQRNVIVALGKTARIDIPLVPTMTDELTVTANTPAIDIGSTVSGVNVTTEAMRLLPLDRRYSSAAALAPGTQYDGVGPGIHGSTGAENQFVVDGLNVTDVLGGIDTKNVAVDFVEEVHVMTTGLPAEYGRITGGVISAVTRSGSDDFRGSVFGYTTAARMFATPKYLDDLSPTTTQWRRRDEHSDYGLTFGGPLVRGRAWAFGAYDRVVKRNSQVLLHDLTVQSFSLPAGAEVPTGENSDLRSAKLTVALTSAQMITASMFGDPWSISGAVRPIQGPPTTWQGRYRRGGNNYVARYSGNFGARWDVNALIGNHINSLRVQGPGTSTPLTINRTTSPITRGGGFGQYVENRNERGVLKVDVTAVAGRHTFKAGTDEEKQRNLFLLFFSGGDRVIRICSVALVAGSCPANGVVYYEHTAWVDDLSGTFNRNDPSTFEQNILNPVVSRFSGTNRSAYVQDSWTHGAMTVVGGLRFERQVLTDRRNTPQITLNNISPRLGLVWDVLRNGRSRLYAHYGRYFESVPMDINRYFGNAAFMQVNNLSARPGDLTPDSRAPVSPVSRSQVLLTGGSNALPVEQRIKGQYLDEYVFGYDADVAGIVTAGAKVIHRNMPRIIEDVLVTRPGTWVIGNPGEGDARSISYLSGEVVPTPRPIRRYNALEIHATRRFTGQSQLFTSYVWSRLYGNYEGLFQTSIGQLNPNSNIAFDYGEYMVNAYGLLATDRTHQINLHGTYAFSRGTRRGMAIGVATRWYSGSPLNAQSSGQFLAPRGSLGRGPAGYEADLHVGYPIRARRTEVELLVDVFNVLDKQGATDLDPTYRTSAHGTCGGIPQELCNAIGGLRNKPGTTEPLAELPDPRASSPNPDFLKPRLFTSPRSIRVGARLRF